MKQLSPSKLSTFLECPRKFRYKYIDRLPDPAGAAAERGLLVHDALELLYNLPAHERTLTRALGCLDMVSAGYPGVDEVVAERLIHSLFAIEDPTLVDVHSTEWDIELEQWRGIIDRIDGDHTIVDYKSGKVPSEKDLPAKTLGIRFYGMLAHKLGYNVKKLVLLYLGTPAKLEIDFSPRAAEVVEAKALQGLAAIEACEDSGNWAAKPGWTCKLCPFLEFCAEGQKSVDKGKGKG